MLHTSILSVLFSKTRAYSPVFLKIFVPTKLCSVYSLVTYFLIKKNHIFVNRPGHIFKRNPQRSNRNSESGKTSISIFIYLSEGTLSLVSFTRPQFYLLGLISPMITVIYFHVNIRPISQTHQPFSHRCIAMITFYSTPTSHRKSWYGGSCY